MPQVFVYIRNDDLDKWKAIEKKSLFLHNALNELPDKIPFTEKKMREIIAPLKNYPESPTKVFVPKPPDPETGYPCCTKRKPCRHWQWNSGQEAWVNELTGKTREADIL